MNLSLTKREINRQRWLEHSQDWKHSGLITEGLISHMCSAAFSLSNDTDQPWAEVVQLWGSIKGKERALTEKAQHIEQLLDCVLLLLKHPFSAKVDRTNKT